MASHAWQALGPRFGAGHGLWSVVSFFFPALAIVKDESVSLAMLLFLLETRRSSASRLVTSDGATGIGSPDPGSSRPCRRDAGLMRGLSRSQRHQVGCILWSLMGSSDA